MMSPQRLVAWFLVTMVAISCQALQPADAVLPKPTQLVTDRAGVLSADEIQRLTKDLQELEQAGLA